MPGARHAGPGCHRRPPAGPAEAGALGRALGHRRGFWVTTGAFPAAPPGLVRMPEGQASFLGDSHTSLCGGQGCGQVRPRPARPQGPALSSPSASSCSVFPSSRGFAAGRLPLMGLRWAAGVSVAANRPLVGLEVFLEELARATGFT